MAKKELSRKINELLGTSIDFTPLKKDDLEELYEAVKEMSEVMGQVNLSLLRKPLKEIIDAKILDKPIGEMSIIELLRAFTREKGILGLGIIPKIRRLLRGEEKLGEKRGEKVEET